MGGGGGGHLDNSYRIVRSGELYILDLEKLKVAYLPTEMFPLTKEMCFLTRNDLLIIIMNTSIYSKEKNLCVKLIL